ncbi:MAG: glycosyltransferase [Cyclobacteriaceae bacterium]
MNHLVSIIIPVYNKAAFVRETLDSALGQTYPNIEVVLINDGSTDGSLAILEEYQSKFPDKIILVDQENGGVSKATNVGIQASRGAYIQFLDADDLLSPDKIENQIGLLKGKPFTMMASCEWVNFKNSMHEFNKVPYGIFRDFNSGIDWLLRAWNHQEMMADSSWMTHRWLVEKAGLWNEELTINQDGEFFCRVLLQCEGILFEPAGKVFYRAPGNTNVSQQINQKVAASLLDSYRYYEREVLKIEDSRMIRMVLKKVYQKFIYDVYPVYPGLIKEAEVCIKNLGKPEKTYIAGPKFQMLSKLFGFKNALRLKRWLG